MTVSYTYRKMSKWQRREQEWKGERSMNLEKLKGKERGSFSFSDTWEGWERVSRQRGTEKKPLLEGPAAQWLRTLATYQTKLSLDLVWQKPSYLKPLGLCFLISKTGAAKHTLHPVWWWFINESALYIIVMWIVLNIPSVKKAECQRIDAFELWCWRRLLRVPWTARKSN